MGRINLNGKMYDVPDGASIEINDNTILVNGEPYETNLKGEITLVIIEGHVGSVKSRASINCGNVKGNVDAGGNVKCDKVSGDVDAGGSVTCGDVDGNVDAGGNINCGNIKKLKM